MIRKFLMAAILTMTVAAGAWAQKDGSAEKKEEAKGTPSETAQNVQLAANLAKYGYDNMNALSLIQAAQIVKENGIQRKDEEGESEGTVNQGDKKNGKISLDVNQLLTDATEYASGDKTLLALVDKVKNTASRGAVNGAYTTYYRVAAHGSVTFYTNFYGQSFCEAVVVGDGDTDLDVYVYDGNWNLIDSDTDYSDRCYVSWNPRWTGKFYIKVVNRGGVYNNMYFYHN